MSFPEDELGKVRADCSGVASRAVLLFDAASIESALCSFVCKVSLV